MTHSQTAQKFLDVMNRAWKYEPEGTFDIIMAKFPLRTKIILDDPTIVCEEVPFSPGNFQFGALGLINGILSELTGERIARIWEGTSFKGFTIYTGSLEREKAIAHN